MRLWRLSSARRAIDSAHDRNVVINHRHASVARITIAEIIPFTLDARLFRA
jgi:hypothetical protein